MSDEDHPNIIIKRPRDCSAFELSCFTALVLESGEVISQGLEVRIKEAEVLIFSVANSKMVAVAAIKNRDLNYRRTIFNKAKSTLDPKDYVYELGWIYVHPTARGQRLSHLLIQAALESINGKVIFATSRAKNIQIHNILRDYGLVQSGEEFPSTRGDYKIVLLTQNVY